MKTLNRKARHVTVQLTIREARALLQNSHFDAEDYPNRDAKRAERKIARAVSGAVFNARTWVRDQLEAIGGVRAAETLWKYLVVDWRYRWELTDDQLGRVCRVLAKRYPCPY